MVEKLRDIIEGFALRVGEKAIRADEVYSRTLDICLADDYLPRSMQLFSDIINDKLVAIPAREDGYISYNPQKWEALACKEHDGKLYWLVKKNG